MAITKSGCPEVSVCSRFGFRTPTAAGAADAPHLRTACWSVQVGGWAFSWLEHASEVLRPRPDARSPGHTLG